MSVKVLSIVGARPQFIKAAMVSRAFRKRDGLHEVLVHTGQHFDRNMSQVFFDEMEIAPPDYHLGVGGGTHGQNTGRMLEKIEAVLQRERPDWVLVYGDTDSTLAGALAAGKLQVPLAHVEAGLRSHNRRMPEEINRVLTDHVAALLFAPTDAAVENLRKEGLWGPAIVRTGDVMYDAALHYRKAAKRPDPPGLPEADFVLCTLHRAENTDDSGRLGRILEALDAVAATMPVVWPIHPRTRKAMAQLGGRSPRAHLLMMDPVGYLQMIWLLERCRMVMTDSGGLQKEAYFFEKPCVTLRDETEWVELVAIGANRLAGAGQEAILAAFLASKDKIVGGRGLYGDGNSASQIAESLLRH
jgi:UDP-GlcNAc3NAcA epimerase